MSETTSVKSIDDKEVKKLCQDYANYSRVNLSEEHGQIVTHIAAIEEQISTFSEMLADIQANNELLLEMLPKVATQFESLKPSFRKIDRMEDLVARMNADFDVLEKQLDDAESTVENGKLKTVLKMPLNLLQKQLSVAESGSSLSSSSSSLSSSSQTFVPHAIFRTEDYFDSEKES